MGVVRILCELVAVHDMNGAMRQRAFCRVARTIAARLTVGPESDGQAVATLATRSLLRYGRIDYGDRGRHVGARPGERQSGSAVGLRNVRADRVDFVVGGVRFA